MLNAGISVLPANLYTSKGYAGVLSPNGLEDRALLVSPTDAATFDVQRFKRLLAAQHRAAKSAWKACTIATMTRG